MPRSSLDWPLEGQFLRNHYREALDAIYSLEIKLDVLQQRHSFTLDELATYVEKEKKYLQGLKEPSPTVSRKTQYVQALIDLDQYR